MEAAEARNRNSEACQTFLEDHAAYIDECLNDDEAAMHEAHAAECPSCARYARVLSRGLELVRAIPDVEPSAHFEQRLQHRIFHIEDGAAIERSSMRSGAGLVAAAMITMIAWSPMLLRSRSHVETRSVFAARSSMEDLVADGPHTADAPHWFANPAQPPIEQTPVYTLVSNAGSYSPLIVSPPAARGPRAVRLVSARSQ
jgi:hypothetical protein